MSKKTGGNKMDELRALVDKTAQRLGYSVWDVRLEREGSLWYLRVYLDSENGISLDDCERMSRELDEPIDRLDPIEQSYFLEVCSPGAERELTAPEHYELMAGSEVIIKLYKPLDGKKEHIAELVGLDKDEIVLKDKNGGERRIAKKDAAQVRVYDPYLY